MVHGGVYAQTDSLPASPNSETKSDSLTRDTATQVIKDITDTLRVKVSKNAIRSDVSYKAKDSIRFEMQQKNVLMFREAKVNYTSIELNAGFINYGFESNVVTATPIPDTAGLPDQKPSFKDGDQAYQSDTMRYNFKTKKASIKGVYTKLNNDGHLYGKLVKKDTNNVLWIADGQFCPCEDKDAKTLIKTRRIKVIPSKKIVTGAGYLSIGKIPTPLAFPFGLFPNSNKQSSGILIPSYGENAQLGFFLINGGYYQPIGERMDLQLTGDIYSKGSYGFTGISRYNTRYRNNGNVEVKYNTIKNSYREFPDFSETRNFFIKWNHLLDAKAIPNTSFSANVNVGSGSTFRNNFNSSITDYVSNSFNSGINYSKRWDGKPYSLNISANHSQNTQTRDFSVTLPNAAFSLQRINLPLGFLKPKSVAQSLWYEKIGFNLNSAFSNRLNTKETELRFDNARNLSKEFRNGVNHQASLSTSLKAWYIAINPRINYNERWYFDRIYNRYFEESGISENGREYGFYRNYDYGFDLNFSTQVFGMFAFKKGPVNAIRHMMTPSISAFYRPKFDSFITTNSGPNQTPIKYNPYETGIFGSANNMQSGGLNFSLNNNLEMKVRQRSDSAQTFKKIKLLEAFSFNSSYDIFRDSLNWSDIQVQARTVLLEKLSVQYSGAYSAYSFDEETGADRNAALIRTDGRLARLRGANLAINWSFGQIVDQTAGKRKKGEKLRLSHILPSGVPITTNLSYNINFTRLYGRAQDTLITTQSFNAGGDIQLLRTIKIGYTTGYDFVLKELTPTFLNIYWDLNCWELSAGYVPFGNRKSYNIRLNMKSAILKDLKLERRRNLSDQNLLF